MNAIKLTAIESVIVGNQGTPLLVSDKKNYEQWLEAQTELTQSWLKNIGYQGKGVALLPDAKGSLEKAVFFTDTSDYFCCGDLATQLPAGNYTPETITDDLLTQLIFGWLLGSYKFVAFKTKTEDKPTAVLQVDDSAMVSQLKNTARAVYLARDLINTPAENLMPQHLAQCTESIAEEFNAQFKQWVGEELLAENYPTIYTVGRASEHPPRLLDLTWGESHAPKVTIVGKGVCFDSGGLDLKPSANMRLMKKDMGGAAHALALAYLVMANRLPVRLRLLLPAVENAIGGNAFRPGDVIVTRQGVSVEIDNTDAEGRLILCDALTEASAETPEIIIDYATLTGAARVALGTELPAMFSSDKKLAADVCEAGDQVGDPVWPMPLHKPYKSMLQTDVADLLNCAVSPFGGAITAALFLQEFVSADIPWLHFDVMAWNNRKLPGRPTGGEAMGLRAVYEYLARRYPPQ